MNRALSSLTSAIAQSLQLQRERTSGAGLSGLVALKRAGVELAQRFDQAEKALVPPREKLRQAVGKFKREEALSPAELRLVFAGLADDDEVSVPILEDDRLFARVHREVDQKVQQQQLNRRDWLALCFSYFSYDHASPDENPNWCVLRHDISQGFEAVKRSAVREKAWMRIVDEHRDLFADQAGHALADSLFEGKAQDLSALQSIAQIPDSSWLWHRIFKVLLSRIFQLDDAAFLQRLPELVKLGQLNTRFLSQVISACLTRYYHSQYREQSCSLLKQVALEQWGSPQMRSKQNLWLKHIEQSVCAMVVAWFAKEDLEHFFTLLKGESEVDQSRLFYWLRYANQMSYTRIVMGSDAWNAKGGDFVAFREKNKGRLSQLTGDKGSNNAVVMQIGNYFFVEFSGTGNACYVYHADSAPFNPDKPSLGLNTELKQQGCELKRMRHAPAPRRQKVIEGWLEKFDVELSLLGIDLPPDVRGRVSNARSADSIEHLLAEQLSHIRYQLFDNRTKGGTLQIKLARVDAQAKTALLRLGFKPINNDPLRYWRN